MKRIKLTVAYDGTAYSGWQLQANADTVEGELNRELSSLLGESIQVIGASRTDAGVHALCNIAVFDTETRIPPDKIVFALNRRLPEDIRVQKSEEVEADYHPRHRQSIKTYHYRIENAPFQTPTSRLYSHFVPQPLDAVKMCEGAAYLIGEHDFQSFCAAGATVKTTVRTITHAAVVREGSLITISVSGTGFLYNMVRIIAGTLMEVGKGKYPPEMVEKIILARDRTAAGPTLPPQGLLLYRYEFPEEP